jgi:hypothetical protein
MRTSAWLVAAACTIWLGTGVAYGQTSTDGCQLGKLSTVRAATKREIGCYAKGARKGDGNIVDSACQHRAIDKVLKVFTRLESPGPCATNGDAGPFESAIINHAENISGTLRGPVMPSRCLSGQIRAAGKKAGALFSAQASNKLEPDPAELAGRVASADAKFRVLFAKAEASGDCFKTGEVETIEGLVDAFVARSVAQLFPVCGDGVRAGTEECDDPDPSTCNGGCLADCTCPAQFCGNGIIEGTEFCDNDPIFQHPNVCADPSNKTRCARANEPGGCTRCCGAGIQTTAGFICQNDTECCGFCARTGFSGGRCVDCTDGLCTCGGANASATTRAAARATPASRGRGIRASGAAAG